MVEELGLSRSTPGSKSKMAISVTTVMVQACLVKNTVSDLLAQ